MRTDDQSADTGPSSTDRPAPTGLSYVAPRGASVGAAVFLLLLSASLLGLSIFGMLRVLEVFGPVENSTGGTVMGVLGASVLGLVNLAVLIWSAGRIPTNLHARFEADESGIYVRNNRGSVLIAWSAIESVRLQVTLIRSAGRSSLLAPRAIKRHATTKLDISLLDEPAAEYEDPMLVTLQPRQPVLGYSYVIPVVTGIFAPSYDTARYAPELQSVLVVFAGPTYAGVDLVDETGFL